MIKRYSINWTSEKVEEDPEGFFGVCSEYEKALSEKDQEIALLKKRLKKEDLCTD